MLITSRNNAISSYYYPKLKPLALAPFSEEEALELPKKMRLDTRDPALIKLIQLLPKYPFAIIQLLHVMNVDNYSPQEFLDKMQQKTELIAQLKAKPKPSIYKASLFEITKSALEGLQSKENGQAPLQLLQQMAYLDAQPIPLRFVLFVLGKEGKEEARAILSTLAMYGLVTWDAQNVCMDGVLQTIIRDRCPLTPQQVKNLF